uniref:Uncharacterized protein n=1 Tax=Globisporangium ultimum (strain ATCC 200006 / CBS 805.95 / DAOM BR144) TaxID=431595 RepID=K3X0L0_GLOUD
MSFLDRFQSKIATVTAHGHLKKADGSEEIRVGPPKRKVKAPSASSNEDNVRVNNPPPGKQHATGENNSYSGSHAGKGATMTGGKHVVSAPVPALPMQSLQSGKQQQQQPNTKQMVQQQQQPWPNASPRNKTGRDYSHGYDNNQSHRDNYHQQYSEHSYYDHQSSIPGRLKDDYYEQPQYTNRSGHAPSKGSPSPTNERYQRQQQDDQFWNQPTQMQQQEPQRIRSPRGYNHEPQQKECRSPKEINESRVQSDQDQLAFSRKARPVQYEPCKLSQYKKEKSAEYYELGKLQPDLNSEELVQKRANAERIKAFSKSLRVINKASQPKKADSNNGSPPSRKTASSTRSKALEFAKRIPKPKHSSRSNPEGSGTLSSTSSSSNIQSIAAQSRPINSVLDDDSEDDQVSSELQQLQLRHQASRAQVEALIKKS